MADLQITRIHIFHALILVLVLNGGVGAIWLENVDCGSYSDVVATDPVGFRYQPVYVRLNRCKGASIAGVHHLMSCQPDPGTWDRVDIQVFDVTVYDVATLHMRNETKCVYKCIVNATVCTSNEDWVEDLCECQCRYHRDELPPPPKCPDGEHWEYSTCACVKNLKHPAGDNGTDPSGYHGTVGSGGSVRTGDGEGGKVISIIVKDAPLLP